MVFEKLLESYRQSPYRNIFFATIAVLLVDALTPSFRTGGLFSDLMMAAIILAALVETVRSRRNAIWAIGLGVPAVAARLIVAFRADTVVQSSAVLFLTSVFFAYLIWNMVKELKERQRPIGERVFGALCAYVFIGIFFALTYAHIEYRYPGSFAMSQATAADVVAGEAGSFPVFTYFSFVTLTTLGFGDITPIADSARTLAWVEALTGQLYLAVMVASLVGMHVAEAEGGRRRRADSPEDETNR